MPERDADIEECLNGARICYENGYPACDDAEVLARLAKEARDEGDRMAGYWQQQALEEKRRADMWMDRADAAGAALAELRKAIQEEACYLDEGGFGRLATASRRLRALAASPQPAEGGAKE